MSTDSKGTVQLRDLSVKRADSVICPACRHRVRTVLAKIWLSAWRLAAAIPVTIVFAPLTMGTTLLLLPIILTPVLAIHSCPRCGLRLAISSGGVGEFRYTVPSNGDESSFLAAPEDWRPDLARLPGGLRIAKSPLAPHPPHVDLDNMREGKDRFSKMRAQRCLKMIAQDLVSPSSYHVIDGDAPSGRPMDEAEVLYIILVEGVNDVRPGARSTGTIKVMMRPPPQYPGDKTAPAAPPFAEHCSIELLGGTDCRCNFTYASQDGKATRASLNTITAKRAQFYPGLPIWGWKSTEGHLLWVSRRFRDAQMQKSEWRLCLHDDYDQLVAVADDSRFEGARRGFVLQLYANLGAGLLAEVLGSLCALQTQMQRVGKELKKEKRENASNAT